MFNACIQHSKQWRFRCLKTLPKTNSSSYTWMCALIRANWIRNIFKCQISFPTIKCTFHHLLYYSCSAWVLPICMSKSDNSLSLCIYVLQYFICVAYIVWDYFSYVCSVLLFHKNLNCELTIIVFKEISDVSAGFFY